VRFPNDCVGSDVLLALEYFGIVYTPDQLVFDSFGAYLRVKLWSEYFTHRSGLAQWVVETLMQTNSKHSHIFVTSPSLQEGDLLVGSKRADVLDGHLQLDPTKYAGTPSNAVVHDFFHDEERPEVVEYPLDALMREDFAHYLQNSLPGTRVTFELKDVQVIRTGKTVKRATLQVTFVEPPKEVPRNSSSKPKKTQKDAPGRQASRPRKSADVAKFAPSVEKLNTIEKGPLGRPHTRSPSPVALLKRVGSAIRKSSSSVDASTEHSQLKQGNVNVPIIRYLIRNLPKSALLHRLRKSKNHRVRNPYKKSRQWVAIMAMVFKCTLSPIAIGLVMELTQSKRHVHQVQLHRTSTYFLNLGQDTYLCHTAPHHRMNNQRHM
jgi:hypothetical protein